MAFKLGSGIFAGFSCSIDCVVESILAECNGILEGMFDAGPSLFGRSFELVEVGLRLLFDGNLLHYLVIGEDEGIGDGRERQDSSEELHVDKS